MSLETLKENNKHVLNCAVQDASGLNDFQKIPNQVMIAIPRVGIERFRIPMLIEHKDGTVLNHDVEASMFVYLEAHKTGANMSRFCSILQDEGLKKPINTKFISELLGRYRKDLRDYKDEKLIPQAELMLKFKYPVKQKSLKSGNWGWQYYEVEIKGVQTKDQTLIKYVLGYEYSSTCPCSLSMSKQYEAAYREGTETEGTGIASAHSQRSLATVEATVSVDHIFHFEDLIDHMRMAIPTETQSLVKRVDEQAFAILNGEHPMFVEHASRRISVQLNSDARIIDWNVKIEHFESLHSHNAVAYISKSQ
ncbi:MAG: GTP cyclohydrolase FolE2 [Bacteriovoracaceae bacterium]